MIVVIIRCITETVATVCSPVWPLIPTFDLSFHVLFWCQLVAVNLKVFPVYLKLFNFVFFKLSWCTHIYEPDVIV